MLLKIIIQIGNIFLQKFLQVLFWKKKSLIQKKNISETLMISRLMHKIFKVEVELASENWVAASKYCLSKNQDAANSFGHKYFVGVEGRQSHVLLSSGNQQLHT